MKKNLHPKDQKSIRSFRLQDVNLFVVLSRSNNGTEHEPCRTDIWEQPAISHPKDATWHGQLQIRNRPSITFVVKDGGSPLLGAYLPTQRGVRNHSNNHAKRETATQMNTEYIPTTLATGHAKHLHAPKNVSNIYMLQSKYDVYHTTASSTPRPASLLHQRVPNYYVSRTVQKPPKRLTQTFADQRRGRKYRLPDDDRALNQHDHFSAPAYCRICTGKPQPKRSPTGTKARLLP